MINWVDVIVVAIVAIILGLVIFFSFIYKRNEKPKGECRYCASANGVKKHRLIKDYNKKYKKD